MGNGYSPYCSFIVVGLFFLLFFCHDSRTLSILTMIHQWGKESRAQLVGFLQFQLGLFLFRKKR